MVDNSVTKNDFDGAKTISALPAISGWAGSGTWGLIYKTASCEKHTMIAHDQKSFPIFLGYFLSAAHHPRSSMQKVGGSVVSIRVRILEQHENRPRSNIALASFGTWEGASPLQSASKASQGSQPRQTVVMSACTIFHRNSIWQSRHFDKKRWLLKYLPKNPHGNNSYLAQTPMIS